MGFSDALKWEVKRKAHFSRLAVSKEDVISAGDSYEDIIASRRAGVLSIACLWGANDKERLLKAEPDYLAGNISEVNRWL